MSGNEGNKLSQEEVLVLKFPNSTCVLLNAFPYQFCQLVCALEACRHPDGTRPVIIIKALPIRELCQWFHWEIKVLVYRYVLGWGACSLGNLLGRQMEVHQAANWHFLHDHWSWIWIAQVWNELTTLIFTNDVVKSHTDFLVHSNEE